MAIQLEAHSQPGGVAALEFLQWAWCDAMGDDDAPKLSLVVLFTSERERWPDVANLGRVARDGPNVRMRRGGAVIELVLATDVPVPPRRPSREPFAYLEFEIPVLHAVSRAVRPVLAKCADRAQPTYACTWRSVVAGIDAFCSAVADGTMGWRELGARYLEQGQDYADRKARRPPPKLVEMDEAEFWDRIATLRARHTVPKRPFQKLTNEQLQAFFGRLSRVLWELDTPTVTKAIYGDASSMSVDEFLDARCAIVLHGPAAVEAAKLGLVPDTGERAEWLEAACSVEAEERGIELVAAVPMDSCSNGAWHSS